MGTYVAKYKGYTKGYSKVYNEKPLFEKKDASGKFIFYTDDNYWAVSTKQSGDSGNGIIASTYSDLNEAPNVGWDFWDDIEQSWVTDEGIKLAKPKGSRRHTGERT